jgi:hypothetical protein
MAFSPETFALSKKYAEEKIEDAVSSVYTPKGSVNTIDDLPTQGNKIGDVYDIISEGGQNYVWTGEYWDSLGVNREATDTNLGLIRRKDNTFNNTTFVGPVTAINSDQTSITGSGITSINGEGQFEVSKPTTIIASTTTNIAGQVTNSTPAEAFNVTTKKINLTTTEGLDINSGDSNIILTGPVVINNKAGSSQAMYINAPIVSSSTIETLTLNAKARINTSKLVATEYVSALNYGGYNDNQVLISTTGAKDNIVLGSDNTYTSSTTAAANIENIIIGKQNKINSDINDNLILGQSNIVRSNYSVALGLSNNVNADYSFIKGQENNANALGLTMLGSKNASSSTALYGLISGVSNVIEGNSSTVLGDNLQGSILTGSLTVGTFNKKNNDNLFTVGNGNNIDGAITRQNAFEVNSDGNIKSGKHIQVTEVVDSNLTIIPDKTADIIVNNPNQKDYIWTFYDENDKYVYGYHTTLDNRNYKTIINNYSTAYKLQISQVEKADNITVSYTTTEVEYYSKPEIDEKFNDIEDISIIENPNGIVINAKPSDDYDPILSQTEGVLNLGGRSINLKTNSSHSGTFFIGDEYKNYPYIETTSSAFNIGGGSSSYSGISLNLTSSNDLNLTSSNNLNLIIAKNSTSSTAISIGNNTQTLRIGSFYEPTTITTGYNGMYMGRGYSSKNPGSQGSVFYLGDYLTYNNEVAPDSYDTAGKVIIGNYNNRATLTANNLFIVGNGANAGDTTNGSNALRLTNDGTLYYKTGMGEGADYAEFFEWSDGNPDNEDRCGLFVTFDFNKEYSYTDSQELPHIKLANEGDYILGVISGNPSFVGNADEEWKKRWLYDEFDRPIMETVQVPITELKEIETGEFRTEIQYDENDNEVEVQIPITETKEIETGEYKTELVQVQNPDYKASEIYTSRSDRKEWETTGMLGVLSVRDDGTCEVGKFCKCGVGGIATKADKREVDTFLVLKRVNDNIIKIIFK